MPAYQYKALDQEGRKKNGLIEADSERLARMAVINDGLIPVSLSVVKSSSDSRKPGSKFQFTWTSSVSLSDLAITLRQLATLLASGIAISDVLATVARQKINPAIASSLMAIRSKVLEGYPLATAIQEYPRLFPPLYQATIEAGEQVGQLDTVLDRLADYTENRQVMVSKIQSALVYPAILTTVAILIVVGLLTYVVPQIIHVFEGTGQKLPDLTTALLAISDFIKNYSIHLMAGLLLLILAVSQAYKITAVKYFMHRVLLLAPLAGGLVKAVNAERFTRTFGILLGSGVSVLEAFRLSARVIPNLPIQKSIESVASTVREGGAIAPEIEKTDFFSPLVTQLIQTGESSGQLPAMLNKAADSLAKEVQMKIGMLLTFFEPLLILVMGGLVMLIVLAILQPILELNQLVNF